MKKSGPANDNKPPIREQAENFIGYRKDEKARLQNGLARLAILNLQATGDYNDMRAEERAGGSITDPNL